MPNPLASIMKSLTHILIIFVLTTATCVAQMDSSLKDSDFEINISQEVFEESKIQDSIYMYDKEGSISGHPLFTQRPISWTVSKATSTDSNALDSLYPPLVYSPKKMKRIEIVLEDLIYNERLNNLHFQGRIITDSLKSLENFVVFMGIPIDTISRFEIICQHCEVPKFNTIDYAAFYLKESVLINMDKMTRTKQSSSFDFSINVLSNAFLIFCKEGYYAEIFRIDNILEQKN